MSKKRKRSKGASDKPDGLKKVLGGLLSKLKRKDHYKFFWHAVSKKEVPTYHLHIKNPMDFGSMYKKVQSGKYSSLASFEEDFKLICDNCTYFNPEDTVYHKEAVKQLEESKPLFEAAKQELLEQLRQNAADPVVAPVKPTRKHASSKKRYPSRPEKIVSVSKRDWDNVPAAGSGPIFVRHKQHKVTRDRLHDLLGKGVLNDFDMDNSPTALDLLTVWARERALWISTGKSKNQRDEEDVWQAHRGPLFHMQFRPCRDAPFLEQFEKRLRHFCKDMGPGVERRVNAKIEQARGPQKKIPDFESKTHFDVPAEILKDIEDRGIKLDRNKLFGVGLESVAGLESLEKEMGLSISLNRLIREAQSRYGSVARTTNAAAPTPQQQAQAQAQAQAQRQGAAAGMGPQQQAHVQAVAAAQQQAQQQVVQAQQQAHATAQAQAQVQAQAAVARQQLKARGQAQMYQRAMGAQQAAVGARHIDARVGQHPQAKMAATQHQQMMAYRQAQAGVANGVRGVASPAQSAAQHAHNAARLQQLQQRYYQQQQQQQRPAAAHRGPPVNAHQVRQQQQQMQQRYYQQQQAGHRRLG